MNSLPKEGTRMTPESLETVRRLATETLNVPESMLERACTLRDAGIDSLAALDLIFAIEGHYGISISAQDVAQMQSLSDLAASVDRLTGSEARRYGA
jgi:acyl carrier protein